jgi:hypothetical protein
MIAVLVYTRKKMSRSRPAQRAWSGLLVVEFTMTKVWSKARASEHLRMRGREVEREKDGSKVLGWNGGDKKGKTGAELKIQLLLVLCSCRSSGA